eukprot:scaffold52669_cov40-Cyclotella_meneghiniana.AAC.3
MVDGFYLVAEVTGSGMNFLNHSYLSANCKTVVTPNNHSDLVIVVVALCDIEANTELTINYAQKNHYMELGGLPLNLKEDACDAVDWNDFLASVPATRMTGITKAIENKNVEGVVVRFLDKLFPNRHSGDHRKGPRAP